VPLKRNGDLANRYVNVPYRCPSLNRPQCGHESVEGRTRMGVFSWLVVGAIAGWLAGLLVKGDESYGVIGHIVLGIVGAIVGGFIAGALTGGDYITGINFTTIVVAVIGAVIAVVAWNAIRGRSRTGRGAL